ncbi:Indoleamine 2,3-dioxygenase [Sparassis crispa]|uniref:Indoleamine 2,3-dioxygenase n=1 Tax=Sparassis crispa TaxID=139825 RepID=A0A401H0U5_9APHY|nr:Indoleamine 2,3-dioxygenase [Sparassis crispa]GBE88051.1 Indoleamine 2,3-dioxygenase [Sparassis crispa]
MVWRKGPPLTRLPGQWEPWEATLDDAQASGLQLSDKVGLTADDEARADRWQTHVRELPILAIDELKGSEVLLRRAHHVLVWIMHFYVHTTPLSLSTIRIPPPLTVPLLQVSAQLQLPPVLTYSDDVLYNWAFKIPPSPALATRPPALDNLRCLTLFTGTRDEEEFYLASARIELRGVEALSLMSSVMDEVFVGDTIAMRRIATYLRAIADVIADLTKILGAVRDGCDPEIFYNVIRPWFRGTDSDTKKRKWEFEGLELDPELKKPTELSGPSAGQSSLIHALDIFFGVDKYSHSNFLDTPAASKATSSYVPSTSASTASLGSAPASTAVPFLIRMQSYMPRHHRAFLHHLSSNPRPLRAFVESAGDEKLLDAYNFVVTALKVFRDEHVRIVALYILSPSKRANALQEKQLKGTGGTDAFQFVKGVRDQTAGALLRRDEGKEQSGV